MEDVIRIEGKITCNLLMKAMKKTNFVESDKFEDEKKNEVIKSEDKIYDYLKEKSENVLSSHYELLGFEIANYDEKILADTVESVFNYTINYKNFDKDPNTVEYIKKAKESGDPYYQTYYDEYLEPKELNIELKAVINKDGEISLYTDNNPHSEREWVIFKMSDIVL